MHTSWTFGSTSWISGSRTCRNGSGTAMVRQNSKVTLPHPSLMREAVAWACVTYDVLKGASPTYRQPGGVEHAHVTTHHFS